MKVYGTRYARNDVIVAGLDHGDPVLGKITQVLVVDGSLVIFQYQLLRVQEYVSHLNSYKVTESDEESFIKQNDLADFHPLSIQQGFGHFANHLFVVLKYRVDYML